MKVFSGYVKKFFIEKGYGFIESREIQEDIFFHIEQCIFSGLILPKQGDSVTFQLFKDTEGYKAINVYKNPL